MVTIQLGIYQTSTFGQSFTNGPIDGAKSAAGSTYDEFGPLLTPKSSVFSLENLTGTNLVVNGGFETGNFSGWSIVNSGTANNNWYNYTGTVSPDPSSLHPIPAPPEGNRAAITDQFGPGYQILYQDLVLAPGSVHTLSFQVFYRNWNGTFVTPANLTTSVTNQQYRVDIITPSAPILSVAPADVLATPFKTSVGDPNSLNPTLVTVDLTPFAGTTVRLRFAVVETQFYFNGGVDDVQLTSVPSYVYVAHGGGNVGAARGGEVGKINLNTFAYTPLTGSLGSLTSLVSNGTTLYAYEVQGNRIIGINPVTGAIVSSVISTVEFTDMAYNPVTGEFYGVGTNFQLYKTNVTTGVATPISGTPSGGGFKQIGFAPNGTLYLHATNSPGQFFTINPTTGAVTSTISGGVPGGALGLDVNPGSGHLIASECCGGSDGSLGERLFSVNPTTGSATLLHDYNDGRRMQDFAFVGVAVPTNTAPSAAADSYSTDEDTPLTVPAAGVLGNDTDGENDPLAAVLVSSPANAQSFALNADGSFSYTPIPDFNGGDSFTYKANDSQADSNIVTVTITVNAVNDAPMLSGVPASATIDELVAYGFTASASDVDLPAQTLTFSLVGAPAGAAIDPTTGVFSWTPSEAQGPGSYLFTVRVSDGVAATDSAMNITVNEVNAAPQLSNVPPSATIDELVVYGFTAAASDDDVPAQSLMFSLVGGPAGALIDPSTGVFSWTPGEDQGPGSYGFAVRVSDGVTTADASITLSVNEVNSPPSLAAIGDQNVDELTLLSVASAATDSDTPVNTLTYSLDTAPAGMSIDPATGAISWTPSESDGPGDYPVVVRVTDDGTPSLFDTEPFSVHVNEINVAPVLSSIGDSTIDEQVPFTFTASAADDDVPANTLAYSLVGAPAGASIDPSTGVFTWTPTEAQGGNPNTPYTFTVRVTDDGVPTLSDDETITLTVREVNRPPVLGSIANQTGVWGNLFSFTASASDPDLPANAIAYSLLGAPAGSSIDASTGAFAWTPTSGQIGSFTFTVRATDNGTPNLYDEKSLTMMVGKRPTALVYTGDGSEQYSDQQALSATLTDSGGGALNGLPVSGKSIGFGIGVQSAGGVTDAAGSATANLILTQNPNVAYLINSSFAGDAFYLPSGDSDPFDIVQEDARPYYTGALFSSTICATCSTATVTLSATIKDITAELSDPATDPFAGDIRNARVTFINRDTNAVIASNLPIGLVSAGDATIGTATYNWNVNIGSADSTDFTIGIVVTNYYARNAGTDNTVVTVSKPLGTNFITGGGYLVLQASAGQIAGASGLKSNFGFNVKYNSSGRSLQGRVNVIVRGSGGRVYQVKGNSMTSLAANNSNPAARTAVFNGKANVTDITNPLSPISLGGNLTLQMAMTDRGEPGSTDTIGLTVWDNAGGLWHSSNWNGTRTIEQLLNGGNLVVR